MVIKDFTQPEINHFLMQCNFTPAEKEFFLYRTSGNTLDEVAELMNISRRTADTYSKKVKTKILKVI